MRYDDEAAERRHASGSDRFSWVVDCDCESGSWRLWGCRSESDQDWAIRSRGARLLAQAVEEGQLWRILAVVEQAVIVRPALQNGA